jgi:membrane protein
MLVTLRELSALVRTSVVAWSADYASSMGAALAFYSVVSLAPLLLVAVAVAGLFFDTVAAQRALVAELQALFGSGAAATVEILLKTEHSPSGGWAATALGVGTLLVGASAVFGELQDALNRIWRAPLPRPPGLLRLVREQLASFAMILAVGALLLVSLILSAAISALGSWSDALGKASLLLEAINFGVSLVLITVSFALIYKYIPRVAIEWRDVWIGAAVTALLFTVGKSLLGVYLGRTAIASTFGAAGSLVLLLLAVYYSAQVFLLGAEFTWAFAHAYGSRRGHPHVEPAVPIPRRAGAAQPPEAPLLVKPWPYELATKRAGPHGGRVHP